MMNLTEIEKESLMQNTRKIEEYIRTHIQPYITTYVVFPDNEKTALYIKEKAIFIHDGSTYWFSDKGRRDGDLPLYSKYTVSIDMMVRLMMNWNEIKNQLIERIEYYKRVKRTIAKFEV